MDYIISMRILVACELCRRQYDAGALPPGAFFRCRCGGKVRVPKLSAKDAAVVRCSSCGGPRSSGQSACPYCRADFTLHEQDMETVCPNCMARVGNKARFCHHCAVPILPEEVAGADTERPCPACGAKHLLRSRALGSDGVSMLECNVCAGIWLAHPTFMLLVERARKDADPEGLPPGGERRKQPRLPAAASGPLYRHCSSCGELMHRFNFGKRSGVIIDSCKDHGVWFDAQELEKILAWVRAGGEERAKKVALEEARVDVGGEFIRQRIDQLSRGGETGRRGETEDLGHWLGRLFDL